MRWTINLFHLFRSIRSLDLFTFSEIGKNDMKLQNCMNIDKLIESYIQLNKTLELCSTHNTDCISTLPLGKHWICCYNFRPFYTVNIWNCLRIHYNSCKYKSILQIWRYERNNENLYSKPPPNFILFTENVLSGNNFYGNARFGYWV